jgi:epoxyqueuosine reductase QueG
MVTKEFVESGILHIFNTFTGNQVTAEVALIPEAIDMPLFDEPLIGIGAADDPLFMKLKEEDVVGPWYMIPKEWYSEAKSVISIFFPLSEQIRASNRFRTEEPSPQWLHGRIEGHEYIMKFTRKFCQWLTEQGIGWCFPDDDSRHVGITAGNAMQEYDCVTEKTFGSNWSERHTAYICGLGTFGLSKGLITEKGVAGRFISVIINREIPADIRPYTGVYDYCSMCGACIRRCPMGAISLEKGNDLSICNVQISAMRKKHAPRYGCALCQTAVPCENRIPKK